MRKIQKKRKRQEILDPYLRINVKQINILYFSLINIILISYYINLV